MQTNGFEDTDKVQIQLKKADDVSIPLNAAMWIDPGTGGNFTQKVNVTAVNFFDIFPSKSSGSGGLGMDEFKTYWFKLRLSEQGSSDLNDLEYIKFLNSGTIALEDVRFANFHVATGDQVSDKAISIHETGFMQFHRTLNKNYIENSHNIYKGGFLYVNDHGGLGFQSQYQHADLTQKDFSWCGGMTSYTTQDEKFIPVNSTAEQSPPEQSYHYKIMMRDGVFKKLILKTGANMGSTTVKVYKNDSQIKTLDFDWEYNSAINSSFDYSLTAEFHDDCTFSEGDAISVSIETSTAVSASADDIIFATEIWYTS